MRVASLRLPNLAPLLDGQALRCRACPIWLSAAALLCAGTAVSAAAVHDVIQKNRAFAASSITISRGDSIAFGNDDEFLHQIYIASMNFDSAEQRPGETISVTFSRPGTFAVRCHIHPKMLLTVQVK